MRQHILPAAADGMLPEKYLRRAYPMISPAMLKKALAKRDVRLDGTRIGAETRLTGGSELKCFLADEYLLGSPLPVLYRDECFAVVVKPQGLPCQRDASGIGEDTAESRVREMFGEAYLVNRLDTFTGGVLPIALTCAARDELVALFRDHKVEKDYLCRTVGTPSPESAHLRHYAVKSADESLVRVYDTPREGALTMALRYEVLERGKTALVRVHLETGRTHQIRAQLSHIGYPVLGDDKYGDRTANRAFSCAKTMLFCEAITFTEGPLAGKRFSAKPDFM